ncbi:MAG: M20/M25/M40 family metallo-hydrolase [Candidatus Heimdallarchaeota archaeon]|nr:M20/M25/M40 family metallo-hydrolase [Candidatus Heimdallarchaeota archaeon]
MMTNTKKIVNREELIGLLSKLVSFDTVNDPSMNKKLTKDCPTFIVDYLCEKGIEANIFEDDGYYSVYGKIGGGDYQLLLMAHFDVVPVGNNWDTDPFEFVVKEGIAYGRGVIDNKNNIASIMTILPEIKKLDFGKDFAVCFEFSGDEEIGGVHSAGNYREKFSRMPDAVINADGAGTVVISRRRNAMGAKIILPKAEGRAIGTLLEKKFETEQYGRHSAYQNPGSDIHALIRASVELSYNDWKAIDCKGQFIKGNVVPDECTLKVVNPKGDDKKKHSYDKGLTKLLQNLRFLVRTQFPTEFSTFGITIGPNILVDKEDHWEVVLDIRAMTQDYRSVEEALREMCNELFGKKNYQLEFKPGQGRVNTPKDSSLVQTALKVSKEFNFPAKVVEMGGASDARYFSREGIPTIDFGPIGGGVHASNEWLNLDSFVDTTEFYLEVVKRLFKDVKKK